MATPDQTSDPTGVIALLLSEGYRFNFFQAVRLMERWQSSFEPVGHDSVPHREVVRFSSYASLEFPASQIRNIDQRKDLSHPARMVVTFMGLTGPVSALPQHYTEIVVERLQRKDHALLEFLDLFNHRLVSLFYRAWEKYQFWILSERALQQEQIAVQLGREQHRSFVVDQRPKLDPIGQILLSLAGLGSPATRYSLPERDRLEPRTEVPDQTWRFYAGLLSHRHRPACGLESILSDHFAWSVKVRPLSGRWLQLENDDRTRLQRGWNTKLGQETVAGKKVWEAQGKFRLQIGPLDYEQFCSLLPIGAAHRPLVQISRMYAGQHLDFDLDLQLRTSEIPKLRCGEKSGIGARLGWNTWLNTRQFQTTLASVKLRSYDDRSE
ncbi:type VI secretion system baseplate subunit TssG [Schlesneria paludicola]|uniref:type VI secretion system baseplate subunit TssG n=1 Tax=Schlesneria paludicola TaxID=360056 RepID=UPI00029A13CE|nr:type VI secretion system baseplate subunit TssG [Schlesneria paludicola]